jgi:hypothetical protein
MDDMPSSHSGHLRHLGHLGHLSYLSTISNLNIIDLYSLDTTLTDSPLKAFITKLDPEDPGLLEATIKMTHLTPFLLPPPYY